MGLFRKADKDAVWLDESEARVALRADSGVPVLTAVKITAPLESHTVAQKFTAAVTLTPTVLKDIKSAPATEGTTSGGHVHAGGASGTSSSAGIREGSHPGISEVLTYTYDPVNVRYEYTGNQLVDATIFGSRWTVSNITYSFPATAEFYDTPYAEPTFLANHIPFNAAQQTAARYAFALLASYTNLTFTEVTESADTHGIIRMSQANDDTNLPSAQGMFPGSDPGDGDIWFGDNNQPFYLTPAIGNWGMATVMHEIGHTMGLKHGMSDLTTSDLVPGGYLDGPGPHYGTRALPQFNDGWAWSLMTYNSTPGTSGFQGEQFNQPQTYMQSDIAALQFLYGANFNSNATDSVYTFNALTGEMFINGIGQGTPEFDSVAGIGKIFRTIWDGNGVDTYDLSNFSDNQRINLQPGAFSTFSQAQRGDSIPKLEGFSGQPGNVANALLYQGDGRSLIENVIAGSGNDIIIGNTASNYLKGMGGDDLLVAASLVPKQAQVLDESSLPQHDTLANAIHLAPSVFGLNPDDNVFRSDSQAHTTITGTGNGTYDMYSFVVAQPGTVVTFDIDQSANLDAFIELFNAAGTRFNSDDQASITEGGAGSATQDDPFLNIVFIEAGTYYIRVGKWLSGTTSAPLDAGSAYTLHLTMNNPLPAGTKDYSDVSPDILEGGIGNDTYIVDSASDSVIEAAGEGTDLVVAWSTYTLGDHVENLTLATTETAYGIGNGLANIIIGNTGFNALYGQGGDDIIYGAVLTRTAQSINESVLPVHDTIATALNLAATAFGTTGHADVADATWFPHTTVFGRGSGAFDMYSFTVDAAGVVGTFDIDTSISLDSFIELFDASGTRIAFSDDSSVSDGASGSFTPADSFLTYQFAAAGTYYIRVGQFATATTASALTTGQAYNLHVSLKGNTPPPLELDPNDGNDAIYAGAGNNTVFGGAGDDFLFGGGGDDSLDGGSGINTVSYVDGPGGVTVSLALITAQNTGGGGTDTLVNFRNLTGSAGNDSLTGNDQDNYIEGVAGADTMAGGLGNDTYTVQHTGDNVIEAAGAGTDLIFAEVDYSLAGRQAENLYLTGGALIGTGNGLANDIRGTEGNNTLSAGGGHDMLTGYGGEDRLDGGTGNDTLEGGNYNDTYVVDAAGDVVVEFIDGTGIDLVESSITYTLGDYVENLTLTGSANLNGTGNALDNVLTGNTGTNILTGGLGNDTYYIQNTADSVVEASNAGTDLIVSSVTYSLSGKQVENLTLAEGAGHINGTGNGLANVLIGNSGGNVLDGGAGHDSISGGASSDTLIGGSGNDTLLAGSGMDSVEGGDGNDVITSSGDGTYNGGIGNDTLYAGLTDFFEVMDGGDGIDTIDTTSFSGSYTLNLVTGLTDYPSESYVNFENAITGDGSDTVTGTAGNNAISTGGGHDRLDGGAGNDTLIGGEGNDTYIVDAAGDVVTEQGDDGDDRVEASVSYTLTDHVESLQLTGNGDINGTGNGLNNFLFGNAGNNVLSGLAGDDYLDGGAGNDSLLGGLGNDAYVVDAGDTITEQTGEGDDLVYAGFNYILGANLENLILTGNGGASGTGNDLANVLEGNSGNNLLSGLGGNDVVDGGGGADTLAGGAGDDTYIVNSTGVVITEISGNGTDLVRASVSFSLAGQVIENLTLTGGGNVNATGNTLGNVLTGNGGNNVLDGGAGNDTLIGGLGDDTYYVGATGDVVTELTGEGTDTIFASVTYSLAGKQVENITLTGAAAINATGNGLANVLIGNGAVNTLDGGTGHDRLDGGAGADSLIGGTGNDTYIVDDAGDTITEGAGGGGDLVESSVTWTLAANVENLNLTGSGAINGTGNDLNNVLTGNGGVNVLSGGLGNDTYYVQNATDNVVEAGGAGTDVIYSIVTYNLNARYAETIILTGSANINATGNSLANTLTGNDGVNTLNGKGGADILTGGLGADIFLFDAASGLDTVTDFSAAQNDSINVHAYTNGVANAGLVTQSGLNVLISLSSGNVITVSSAVAADVLAHMVW
ncbi:hypothetical protein ABAC460_09980 [Asticcacaulis sp. AC460]|uniref:M10 family metallopeptidase C-terminal domain-containing protein n=1 Tax=Asticcacaulis sp. AC460 TaxID=1282360 RepID=UPI0003C3C62D|nr:M10 family metallopeptidase C-terminal domain-containing protein [Asticcacaulis sp. AC460]ESQ90087.1 hypothetical protein ABAC460_09980 [Asticcacaulis sp. AC460]